MMWKRIFGRSEQDQEAYAIYAALVSQARLPAHYLDGGVPDTLEGRFEMVALHAFLVLRRLRKVVEADAGRAMALSQKVFDILFDDMDQTLREIGISDLKVGKEIKGMAQAFYGRVAAYDEGLDSPDNTLLSAALQRNLYAGAETADDVLSRMVAYVRHADADLAAAATGEFLNGKVPPFEKENVA
ncbi:MAG: ubiquinol-cytochrome C chaperone family protein [Parvibaculum sp.]|nr:ubiquinol-cytochrome C chaperone family protein [Parvibaculum sp.]